MGHGIPPKNQGAPAKICVLLERPEPKGHSASAPICIVHGSVGGMSMTHPGIDRYTGTCQTRFCKTRRARNVFYIYIPSLAANFPRRK